MTSRVRLPLKGRSALVTGATGGLGEAIARRLSADGAELLLTDHPARLRRPARGSTVNEAVIPADLTRLTDITLLTEAVHAAGGADILISNAGTYPRVSWDELNDQTWQQQLDINLTSHYRLTRAVASAMAEAGWGRIITIGSIQARHARRDLAAYTTAKAGLEGLTRALAREFGDRGVTANCIAPGSIQVPAEHLVVDDIPAMTERQLARQCIQRRGQPDDVAAAVTFLASSDSGFITGQTLHVDGGQSLG